MATVVSDAHFVGKAAYARAKGKLPIGDNGRIAIRTKFFDETIRMAMYENPTGWNILEAFIRETPEKLANAYAGIFAHHL